MKCTKSSRFKKLGDSVPEGMVRISGFANRFMVDAYKERMDPLSVKLERYKQNPILLFNHDMNYPVGRVVAVEPREDGLWVEAVVSSSDNEKVSFVRDLVADGTLCTFSVRFADETVVEDPEVQGGKLIKDWELQEVSIVSIPAQPDSTFSLANVKSLKDLREIALKAKGAMVAKIANDHISKLVDSGEKKEDLLQKLSDASGAEPPALAEVLAGNVTPVPEPILGAFSSILGCESTMLNEANAADVEAQKSMAEEEMPKEGEKAENPPLSQAVQECVSEKIPKLIGEGKPQDQAVAIAISMCSKEKGCSEFVPTREMMAKWLEECDNIKQAEQDGQSKETAPLPSKEPEGMNDNAHLMLLKSQLEMLGSISVKLDALKEAVLGLAAHEQTEVEKPEVEAPETEVEVELPAEAEMAMKNLLDEYEAKLKALLA